MKKKDKICPECGDEYTERRKVKNRGLMIWYYRHFDVQDGRIKWCIGEKDLEA